MPKFIPMINCGYCAGQTPECWDGTEFESEAACDYWINSHMDEFSDDEMGGGIYPHEV